MDLQSDKRDFHLDIIPEEKRITSRKKLSAPRFFAFCTIYYSDATKAAILLQWVLNYLDNDIQKYKIILVLRISGSLKSTLTNLPYRLFFWQNPNNFLFFSRIPVIEKLFALLGPLNYSRYCEQSQKSRTPCIIKISHKIVSDSTNHAPFAFKTVAYLAWGRPDDI